MATRTVTTNTRRRKIPTPTIIIPDTNERQTKAALKALAEAEAKRPSNLPAVTTESAVTVRDPAKPARTGGKNATKHIAAGTAGQHEFDLD